MSSAGFLLQIERFVMAVSGKKIKIAVLLSGGGTTLQNLIDKIGAGELNAEVVVVVSSKDGVAGIERAQKHNIPAVVVPSKNFRKDGAPDWTAMSREINRQIKSFTPDLICLCGFMCFYLVPEEYTGKVMNIHPALIPAFCGRGMWGHNVHEAVIEAGVKVSGCTVHFVNDKYDAGPVILQRTCPVYPTDTPDTVAARVFIEECQAYPEAIRLFAAGRLKIEEDVVRILPHAAR
jgi:phosphoribosylglycinamide formyltransferase 1